MPLPPGPPREWRAIVERGLAGFNGMMLVAFFCAAWVPGPSTLFGWFLCMVPALALYGFLSHAPRRQRAFAVVPSGLLWLLVAFIVLIQQAYAHRQHPPTPVPWTGPIALALFFLTAGALTVEFTVARLRRA